MATQRELIEAIQRKLIDDSYTAERFVALINKALLDIASYKDPETGEEIFLPALETNSTVTTNTLASCINLPSDYHKNLYAVTSADSPKPPITILANLQALAKRWRDNWNASGAIEEVAVAQNRLLWYQPIPPTPDTLTLFYYMNPPVLVNENQEPSCIPAHLQEDLIVSHVLKELFSEVEDGAEGAKKINTSYYENKFAFAMGKLYTFIKDEKSIKRPYRPRKVQFF